MSLLQPDGYYDTVYMGHMMDKIANVYQKPFPVRSEKQVFCYVAG